ncbi:MAG: hypothetical protein GY853_09105 [PVC group bacterium]|nr:hypothetical protein [PVC group bacterium]
MTDKLEKLTKQIYDEGIGKAKEEAAKIIQTAEAEKKKILRAARQEAEDITAAARKEAEDLRKRAESEIRMASQQSLSLLRQKITGMISKKVAKSSATGLIDDSEFLKKTVLVIMKEWICGGHSQGQQFYLRLPADMQKNIQEYLLEKGKEELDKGLKIEFDENIKSGFVISPEDGNYRIGFTEADFKSLIDYFLRPRMKEFLFKSE